MSRDHTYPAKGSGARFVNFKAVVWVGTLDGPTGLALALLHTIARHSDKFGCSWCARSTLAKESGCSIRTVASHLKTLEALNLIRRIGRLGDHGGRVSSVLVLCGWPERNPIPPAGHPLLGKSIKEDKYDALKLAYLGRRRKSLPEPRENSALQNKISEKNITTDTEKTRLLDVAFEALGRWATEENRRYLSQDVGTLIKLIEDLHDPERVILPVLREKAEKTANIPTLRTWRYFLKAFEARGGWTQDRKCASITTVNDAIPKHRTAGTDRCLKGSRKGQEAAIDRVLAGCVKNFRRKPDRED
ncbi:helix-turn-helix domain-containing protein [Profundibacter sp.]